MGMGKGTNDGHVTRFTIIECATCSASDSVNTDGTLAVRPVNTLAG